MTSTKTPIQFEQALSDLDQTVEALERGDLSLEEALKTYEKGVQLVQHCQKSLQEAENRVKAISEQLESVSSE